MRRAFAAGLLAMVATLLAAGQDGRVSTGRGAADGTASASTPIQITPGPIIDDQPGAPGDDLLPRRKPPKPVTESLRIPDDPTGRLLIKFNDDVKARPAADGSFVSAASANLTAANIILARERATAVKAINHSQDKLTELQERAAALSGRAQPDLGSIMYIDGDLPRLLAVAKDLNDLPQVEWVQFETKRYSGFRGGAQGGAAGGAPEGACCLPSVGLCEVVTEANCMALEPGAVYQGDESVCEPSPCGFLGACCVAGDAQDCLPDVTQDACETIGVWAGPLTTCDDEDLDCNLDCGNPLTGDCFDPEGNGSPYCTNDECCAFICDIDPFCCDEMGGEWDEICAAEANFLCDDVTGCASPINGSCFEAHNSPGCNVEGCCDSVCFVDPLCCEVTWDEGCVDLALEICQSAPAPDATPDYSSLQGYRTAGPYDPADIPADLLMHIPNLVTFGVGFDGQGWNLYDPDDPNEGLYGMSHLLFDEYGVGLTDPPGSDDIDDLVANTRGRSVKVAIIEWGYYTDHEELQHVTPEPGQTIFQEPDISAPDHGTACLSIATGRDDGRGVVGVAPESRGFFFPLSSVEEGPRELSAWVSAMLLLGPGDVISASYGPAPPTGCINNVEGMWTLIRMASDLGITVCIAAGNDCYNLDGAPDLGDSGAMVVGACSPGVPWFRLPFSNFCTEPDNARSNIVHVKAWGESVTSAGYGSLLFPSGQNPQRRFYHLVFNGTSAASPQIAGLVACLQGLAKQFYGIPLNPEQIRGALGAPGVPPPNPARLFGGFDDAQGFCSLDLDTEQGPHMIGPYPTAAGNFDSAASRILNQGIGGFDQSPTIESFVVARGQHLFGNSFSLSGLSADWSNYLVIRTQHTTAGSHPSVLVSANNPIGQGVISAITYFGTGQIADLVVSAKVPNPAANMLDVSVVFENPGNGALAFIEAWDWQAGRWMFQGFSMVDTLPLFDTGDPFMGVQLQRARRFIHQQDKRVLIRFWIFGFATGNLGLGVGGAGGPNEGTFNARIDFVGVEPGQQFGEVIPPGGLGP